MSDIPEGFCQCGCGQRTNIIKKSVPKFGYVKGRHHKFAPNHNGRGAMGIRERFWSKVNIGKPDECWEWKSGPPNRYCSFSHKVNGKRKSIAAHVYAFQDAYGPVPEGKEVCHSCDNKKCCNPNHLTAETHLKNMQDAYVRNRMYSRKGMGNNHARFSDDDILAIRQAHRDGVPYRITCEKYHLQSSNYYQIVGRKSWTHLP